MAEGLLVLTYRISIDITIGINYMFLLFGSIFLLISCHTLFGGSGQIVKPIIYPVSVEIYVSLDGKDTNNRIADFNSPLHSFDSIFSVLKSKTKELEGDIYCSVNISKGRYVLSNPIEQLEKDFIITENQKRKLHISFIGLEDSVILDGTNIKRGGGYGLIRLSGSNTQIRNIIIKNAPSFGLVIGQPFARSTNVLIDNVCIDSTYSHGLLIGNTQSLLEDTVHIRNCIFTETNQMNAGGLSKQWGSALKLFGAKHILIENCLFEHNWSEAISINNSNNVNIKTSRFFNNYAPSVYCDIARNITIDQNVFIAKSDSIMYKEGKRGMVAILLSNEAWDPAAVSHITSNIDIFSNVFLGQSGVLDIWEGTVSFLQTSIVENVRFAFNSTFGMSEANKSSNTSILSTVFSTPIPFNRTIDNIFIYGNVFSVDPQKWSTNLWFRSNSTFLQRFTFKGNRWNSAFPSMGNFILDDSRSLPDTLPSRISEILDFKKKIPSLRECEYDNLGRERGKDSSFAGAFEFTEPLSVVQDSDPHISYIYSYFPNETCIIPKQWINTKIVCVGLKGEEIVLENTGSDSMIRLPGTGPYFLYPQKNVP